MTHATQGGRLSTAQMSSRTELVAMHRESSESVAGQADEVELPVVILRTRSDLQTAPKETAVGGRYAKFYGGGAWERCAKALWF